MTTQGFSGIRNNGRLPSSEEVAIPDDIGDLLGDYIDSTNSLLDELERAALAYESGDERQENAAAIRRVLHKAKGESQMVGVDEIRQICHEAEDAFEELDENRRPDMLLKVKDWICGALYSMTNKKD